MSKVAGAASEDLVIAQIEGQEKALYEALARSDGDLLEEIFSDDLVYIHSEGVADTKYENIIGQRDGFFKHGRVHRINGCTSVFGDIAVTVGAIEMIDLGHGPANDLHLEQTLVWVKETGAWRLLLRQATKSVS